MKRKKAWHKLTEPYRERLHSNGISRKKWADGADLRKARGHAKKKKNAKG